MDNFIPRFDPYFSMVFFTLSEVRGLPEYHGVGSF
jgi:hypothetical protein